MLCDSLGTSYSQKPKLTSNDRIRRYSGPVLVDSASRCNVECALDPQCVGFLTAPSTSSGSLICTLLSTADFGMEVAYGGTTYYPFQSCRDTPKGNIGSCRSANMYMYEEPRVHQVLLWLLC